MSIYYMDKTGTKATNQGMSYEMKRLFFSLLLILLFCPVQAQVNNVSLEDCQRLAVSNYPLIQEKDLIKQANDLVMKNIYAAYYPQVQFGAQVSYQSAVIALPIELPGIVIPTLARDQYKAELDAQQTIYDGHLVSRQKDIQQNNYEMQQQKVDVALYQLKDRINQMYFTILMGQDNDSLLKITSSDLKSRLKIIETSVKNGTLLSTSADMLSAQILNIDERIIENHASKTAALNMLGALIGRDLDEKTVLQKPAEPAFTLTDNTDRRPEFALYAMEKKSYIVDAELIKAKTFPKFSAFLDAGYGRPGLNFLDNSLEPYYIAGLRFGINLSNYYTNKKELEIQFINSGIVDKESETLRTNLTLQLKQEKAEMDKLDSLMVKDEEIIALHKKIAISLSAQLENGVITATDYLSEVNSQTEAQLALQTHRLQKIFAKINYQTIQGK